MKKICIVLLTLVLAITMGQAEEKKNISISKFKKQNTMITPLSRTRFEVIDKHGKVTIVDLKGKKFIVVSVSEPGSESASYAVDEDGNYLVAR